MRQRLQLPRRRGTDSGRVRQEHPVRPGRWPIGARPRRPGIGCRPIRTGLRDRSVRRVVRHPAAGRHDRQACLAGCADALHRQRRPARSVGVREWQGGERYGNTHDDYYAELRGTVTGTEAGDEVEVWFSGRKRGAGLVTSEHFSYTVHDDIGGDVLILAVEDVTGISPAQAGATSAKYADEMAAALTAAGRTSDVYDFDTQDRKAPHHLGVLSHYDAVLWETGDDIILRAPGQVGGTTMKAALDIELSVRDYLNEGGKALVSGKYALFAQSANGAYFYNPNAPPPECTTPQRASDACRC